MKYLIASFRQSFVYLGFERRSSYYFGRDEADDESVRRPHFGRIQHFFGEFYAIPQNS